MKSIDDLLEEVNNYYHDQGCYPEVEVSQDFFDEYAWEIEKLSKDGIEIQVVAINNSISFSLNR